MSFVRKKGVGQREYYQLVENYREDGAHRQKVLAHLGKHATVEDAVAALRKGLEALDESRLVAHMNDAASEAKAWEENIQQHYAPLLQRYHGAGIPTEAEVHRLAQDYHSAPHTDEVIGRNYFGDIYTYQEIEVPDEVEQYRRAFGSVREAEGVTRIGARVHYDGLFHFEQWIRSHDYWKRRARLKHQEYEKRKQHLKERIEKLKAFRSGD
jgi:hypothetical protein